MTLQPFLCDFDGSYASGKYRLVHSQAGFGIDVVDILIGGELVHRETGHNALLRAQSWAHDHASGANMAEEVRLSGHERGMMR